MLFSCKNDYQEVMDNANFEQRPSQEAIDIDILRTDSGRVVFKMQAPLLKRFTELKENPYEEFPNGLTITTFSDYPNVESYISCKYAIHYIDKELWEARDDVVAINIEGDTVTTEQMFWNMKEERIYSDKYVNIRRNNEVMHGIGFESNQTLTNVEINQFKGIFYVDE